jgi:extracellular matrix regulatory protein A
MARFLNIGLENSVNIDKIISIVNANSNHGRRLIKSAKEENILIDATGGKKTKSIIITESRIITSSNRADTLRKRFNEEV